jgi:hypothetical protein
MMRDTAIRIVVVISCILLGSDSLSAQNTTNQILSPRMQGLWVTDKGHECPELKKDEDAYGMGGGALLLRGDKFYSHESLCRIVGRITRGCCDDKDEETLATTYSCGRYRGRVVFALRRANNVTTLIEVIPDNAASGPIVKVYQKKCS